MLYTNKHNLHPVVVQALIKSDEEYMEEVRAQRIFSKYSVTQLLKEPRAALLVKRHWHKIEVDVSSLLFSFLGNGFHTYMEKGAGINDIPEERLVYKVHFFHPKTGKPDTLFISGKSDIYLGKDKGLIDHKLTSVFRHKKPDAIQEYKNQLELYRFLFQQIGLPVETMENNIMYRDWSEGRHGDKIKIPFHRLIHTPTGLIDEKHPIKEWIHERVQLFENCSILSDKELPECSEDFRWSIPGQYKIYWDQSKAKDLKSMKNFNENQYEEARKYCNSLNKKPENIKKKKTFSMTYVSGDPFKRCHKYCHAKNYCNQYQQRGATKEQAEEVLSLFS
jgi:hypothetical protein